MATPSKEYFDTSVNVRTIETGIVTQLTKKLYFIFPMTSEIVGASGVVIKTGWDGAIYNLLLYILTSHVIGVAWYLLSI